MHTAVPPLVGSSNLGPVTLVIHAPAFEPGALDFEVGYTIAGSAPSQVPLSRERVLTTRLLPGIEQAATIVHVGPTSDTHRAYGALATWLETHGWSVLGPGRQVLLRLPLESPESEAVVELQLPVRRTERT